MEEQAENVICFQITSKGKVKYYPEISIHSTSFEMQEKIKEIVPQLADYMEFLLEKKFNQND